MQKKEIENISLYLKDNLVNSADFEETITDYATESNLRSLIENIGVSLIGAAIPGSTFHVKGEASGPDKGETQPDAGKIELWMVQQMEEHDSFQKMAFMFLEAKGYKDNYPAFYKKIGMDRQIFSKYFSESNNLQPHKKTVFKIVIGLELDLGDADKLLHSAGYNFNFHRVFDLIIRYCVENKIYKPEDVDEYLLYFNMKPLFASA